MPARRVLREEHTRAPRWAGCDSEDRGSRNHCNVLWNPTESQHTSCTTTRAHQNYAAAAILTTQSCVLASIFTSVFYANQGFDIPAASLCSFAFPHALLCWYTARGVEEPTDARTAEMHRAELSSASWGIPRGTAQPLLATWTSWMRFPSKETQGDHTGTWHKSVLTYLDAVMGDVLLQTKHS